MRLPIALILAALLVGCGGDEPDPAPQQPAQEEPTRPDPTPRPTPADTDAVTEAPEPEPATDRELYTVQVAAFTNPVTAREWADRLRADDLPVWTSMAEIGGRTFHRLRLGALPSVTGTRRLAELISDRYHWPVWVAPVTPSDRVPVNAVEQTRALLGGAG